MSDSVNVTSKNNNVWYTEREEYTPSRIISSLEFIITKETIDSWDDPISIENE